MAKSSTEWVPCLRCIRGPHGEKSCAAGFHAKNNRIGCFIGKRLSKNEK